MRPIAAAPDGARFVITHKCEKCGKVKRQRTCDDDDIDMIIEISRDNNFIFGK